jgi:hypothetical protein
VSTLNDSAYNVTTLAALTGMPKTTAAAWIRCEGQGTSNPTNPLNIGYWGYSTQRPGPHSSAAGAPGSGFASYSSALAGLTDAARMIATSGHYVGIRNAIATRDAVKVAQAIEASPWATGHYGGGPGKAGCIVKGVNGGAAPSSGGSGAPPATTAGAPAAADAAKLQAGLVAAGISTDPTHVLTTAEALALTRKVYPLWRGGTLFDAGQTVGDLLKMKTLGTQGAEAVGGLLNFAWLPGFAVNAGILVLVAVLGYKGFERILD